VHGAPEPPRDYADDPDPTGYYERKTKHREEMLPLLAWVFGAGLVCLVLAAAWNVFQ